MSELVDWDFAVRLGSRIAGPGPVIGQTEGQEVVAQLRQFAADSTPLVREFTGLTATAGTADTIVVDRAGWVQANAEGFSQIIAPLLEQVQQRRGAPSGLTKLVGSKVTGLEMGGLLGFLAGKVLGQFDPFHAPVGSQVQGRLMLVAPNIVAAERELGVDPRDFRLWVCLHEETHRVQFTAVPWMRDHIHQEIGGLVGAVSTDPSELAAALTEGLGKAIEVLRGKSDTSLMEIFAGPEQREAIDRITAVMSLLEGHADVVMDGVGPGVIPTVSEIRTRFTERRRGIGPLDRVLRRLLGMEAKMAQYRDGAHFVRGALDVVGMDGFNAVWESPDNLPTRGEIGDPAAWVKRVHG